ncbi:GNAT family N-acetyltransferase [Pseudoroseomonas cervicalis]|uniref:GNAT family N-acetyltransferase n=1 Tax=Teichococcus cervicalis TaxID=204525 RepID=UPI00278539CF|nr:GNAT family N-acetyltransferase [Pseudoroseomonas cervicalis]MDQ1080463.1 GNAT superfamily N-acetyltransferase [Pseudoroseomonas cervicalis]
MSIEITSLTQRPDLAPQVAAWLWQAFWQAEGHEEAEVMAMLALPQAPPALPRSFVLLRDGVPLGTASLAAGDLEARPLLTPWLAGLYVVPEARRQGHAARLARAVQQAARAQGAAELWLYTDSAEALYERLGWVCVERLPQGAGEIALMRCALEDAAG